MPQNGEKQIFMIIKNIFITTKLVIRDNDTKESILERFGKCQESGMPKKGPEIMCRNFLC